MRRVGQQDDRLVDGSSGFRANLFTCLWLERKKLAQTKWAYKGS